jgi:hypothetical protein
VEDNKMELLQVRGKNEQLEKNKDLQEKQLRVRINTKQTLDLICKDCRNKLFDSSLKLRDNFGKSILEDDMSMISENASVMESRIAPAKGKKDCVLM